MKRLTLALLVAGGLPMGCEPVAVPGGGAAAGPAGSPAAPEVANLRAEVEQGGQRVDALERALLARDKRIRELDQALLAANEKGAADLAALRKEMHAAIDRLERENAETRAELVQASRTLEALRSASPLPNLTYDVPRIEGRVLSVERTPRGPRVLLDVGKRQGVEAGYEFTISRAERAIAKIAVDRVENEISSGSVVYARDGETVREGDQATTRP